MEVQGSSSSQNKEKIGPKNGKGIASSGVSENAVSLFRARVAASGSKVAARRKVEGAWQPITWAEWDVFAREIAAGLIASGVQPGDRVCVLAQTRLEWAFSDVGVVMAGAVTVPIYPSNTPEQCEYIIGDSGAQVVFVEDGAQLAKLKTAEVAAKLGQVRFVAFEATAGATPLADLRATGRTWLAQNSGVLEQRWATIRDQDAFTIVYTSGTTGPPKGVVLSHSNICFEVNSMREGNVGIVEGDEQLLFLPLAHIFAKVLLWMAIERGVITAFAESIAKVADNMKEVRPTFMGSVPRIYEKVYAKVVSGAEEAGGLKRAIFHWAMGVGRKAGEARQRGESVGGLLSIQYALAEKLVFSKLKAAFGGRLRFFVSGGAPLAREIAEFFHSAGVLVLEGYGLTETTAATHVNRPYSYRFGTVGLPLPGVEVKIAGDGEILLRGKNIMREYFGMPEATAESIDSEGWFHSGDIGVVEDGFLRITDRKKDIIVTAGGKNIAPQNIEGALKTACALVSQAMVVGDKRPYLVALVTLSEENIRPWAKERGLSGNYAELTQRPEVHAVVEQAVANVNAKLASYESIKKIKLLDHDFSQETGELTPTLKVKRKFTNDKYRALIEDLYV